tara:strand:- start:137 stop:394 length:258 start_codon:yes stop_codon:yes gene_type:complete
LIKKTEHMKKEDIVKLILSERNKQDIKWGEQNHDIYKWLAILGEEVGEVNKAALEDQYDEVIDELVQVAAVAVAMIESLDRNRNK